MDHEGRKSALMGIGEGPENPSILMRIRVGGDDLSISNIAISDYNEEHGTQKAVEYHQELNSQIESIKNSKTGSIDMHIIINSFNVESKTIKSQFITAIISDGGSTNAIAKMQNRCGKSIVPS